MSVISALKALVFGTPKPRILPSATVSIAQTPQRRYAQIRAGQLPHLIIGEETACGKPITGITLEIRAIEEFSKPLCSRCAKHV